MSNVEFRSLASDVIETSIDIVWAQWEHLGAHAQGHETTVSSIIDPEALLLYSLSLEPHERRLADFTRWWAKSGSDLLSVQRVKTLRPQFPSVTENLSSFAHCAVESGDNRWKRLAADAEPSQKARRDAKRRGRDRPHITEAPGLMLRLRAGFGVSAKADVMAYLLGIREKAVSRSDVAASIGYSRATVRAALSDLSRAEFIHEEPGRPTRYYVSRDAWSRVLDAGPRVRPPQHNTWRHWSDLFAFFAQTTKWAQQSSERTPYIQSSKARDIFEANARAVKANRIRVPRPENYRGTDYLLAFEDTLATLVEWARQHV